MTFPPVAEQLDHIKRGIAELIPEEENLVQRLWIVGLQQFNPTTYRARLETRVGSLFVTCTCPVFMTSE